MKAPCHARGAGLTYALGAYALWGIVPVYFKWLSDVPPVEIVAQRIVWTVPLLTAMLVLRRQTREFAALLRNPALLRNLFLSASLIGTNWLAFIWAVNSGHILATSIAYYINPLVTVLLGRIFLAERLNHNQMLAVAVAAIGVALLAADAVDTLWVSLFLAGSFAGYGLIRKVTPVGSVPGLAMETLMLAPLALVAAGYHVVTDAAHGFGSGMEISLLLTAAGVVTAVPLLMFATAARRMSLTAMGFCQYLAPSITFCLGVFVYGEPMNAARLASFALIWVSIAIFSVDALATLRRARRSAGQAL